MPLLLYCVTRSSVSPNEAQIGVAGIPVDRIEGRGLAAFVSRNADSNVWLRAPVRTSALEFHRVLMELFESTAIIPFRFPTIFESNEKLRVHLSDRASEYDSQLERIGDSVQMEIRVMRPDIPAASASGADYLRERQKHLQSFKEFGAQLHSAVAGIAREWSDRSLKDGQRYFALVDRTRVAEFEQALRGLTVAEGINTRVSGPWPVSEFLGTISKMVTS
jgi:hypothetical protein